MITKERLDALRERYVNAKSQREINSIREEMSRLCDEDVEAVGLLTLEQIKETRAEIEQLRVREQIEDICPMISLSYIAKTYFHKSRAWLSQRMNGSFVNGKRVDFTDEEKQTLAFALNDMGRKLSEIRIS